jgi:hypothetical protein
MNQTILNRSRNDKFIMILDLPKAMKKKYDKILKENFKVDTIQLSIFGSPVPEVTVPDISLPFGGQVHKISSNSRPAYNPLTVKFLIDNGYKNYWILWNWINLFNDSKTSSSLMGNVNGEVSNYNLVPKIINPISEYVSRFSIFSMDEFNNKIISFTYNNAFPTNLSEINFSNQDSSEITCTVTFSFNQLNVELVKNVNESTC